MFGCPGLQFALGNKIKLFSALIALWLFNIPLAVIAPIIIAFVVAVIYTYYALLYIVCLPVESRRFRVRGGCC